MRKIVLTVSSAKVVNTNLSDAYGKKKKYRETIGRNGTPIESINDMDNIIHINHIVNALHVMFGARPVSFKYGNPNQLSQKIIDIVEKGIMRYDNVYTGETNNNGSIKTVFYNEFTQGKKPFRNSNRDGLLTTASNGDKIPAYITWSTVYKNSLYKENMRNVLKIIKEYSEFIHCDNIADKYTFIDVLTDIKYNNPEWIERFKEIPNITTILNFFEGNNKEDSAFNKIDSKNLAGLGNINAPTPKVSVDATIILFMEDEDAENLLRGKRYATILDNGFIYIANNEDNNIINNIREFNVVDNVDNYIEDYLDEGFVEIKNLPYTNEKTEN